MNAFTFSHRHLGLAHRQWRFDVGLEKIGAGGSAPTNVTALLVIPSSGLSIALGPARQMQVSFSDVSLLAWPSDIDNGLASSCNIHNRSFFSLQGEYSVFIPTAGMLYESELCRTPSPFPLDFQSPIQLHLNSPLLHIDISSTIYDIYCKLRLHALPKCSTCSRNEDRSFCVPFLNPPLLDSLQIRYVQFANEPFASVTHIMVGPDIFATPEAGFAIRIAPAVHAPSSRCPMRRMPHRKQTISVNHPSLSDGCTYIWCNFPHLQIVGW